MTFIHVDVHRAIHTCPADPAPHPIDIRRTVIAVVDGGPCHHPITVHSGDVTAVIRCGRREPYRRQCPACRTVVIERSITTTDLGHHGPDTGTRRTATDGLAAHPCTVCGQPLSAVLADHGTHLLCRPRHQPQHGTAEAAR